MWDAVRKIFSHDAAPEDVPPSRNRTMPAPAEAPSRADSETRESGQDMAANAADVSGPCAPERVTAPAAHAPLRADAVEVSPPGHAPQGLAAEPDAHNAAPASSPTEEDATTRRAEDASQGLPAAAVSPPAESEAPSPAMPSESMKLPRVQGWV